jgi:hypothetical protein
MKGVGAGTRIFDLLAREPVISPNKGKTLPPKSIGIVKFENIRFAYPKRRETQVLNGFNMEIKPGESVALVYASLTPICTPKLISAISADGVEVGRAAYKPSCFVSMTYVMTKFEFMGCYSPFISLTLGGSLSTAKVNFLLLTLPSN